MVGSWVRCRISGSQIDYCTFCFGTFGISSSGFIQTLNPKPLNPKILNPEPEDSGKATCETGGRLMAASFYRAAAALRGEGT